MEHPQPPPKFKDDLPTAIELSSLSVETLEVLQHFGPEAPNLLNNYCIKLEDVLISTAAKLQEMRQENERLLKLLNENNIDHSA